MGSSDPGTARGAPPSAQTPAHGTTGLGIVNGGSGPSRQQQQQQQQQPPQMPPRWPFLLKLEVLRSISPPLKPPGAGQLGFETRGPLIAIEGAATSVLREVASVVEKALSVSGEYAVKTWTEDHAQQAQTQTSAGGGETGARKSSSNSNNNNNNDPETQPEQVETTTAPAKRPPGLASYIARMLRWHKTSEDLIRYITHHPRPSTSSGESAKTTTAGREDAKPNPPKQLLPVAIVADGYSLTTSDRYAASLQVGDAYRADDHWQWVATLWRGIVGADLTIYVKRVGEAEVQSTNCVEFVGPGVMVLRILTPTAAVEGGRGGGTWGVDERLERRLGFEIIEWVRSGSFRSGFVSTTTLRA